MYKLTSNVWVLKVNTKAQLALSLGNRSCVCPIPLAWAHLIGSESVLVMPVKSFFFFFLPAPELITSVLSLDHILW